MILATLRMRMPLQKRDELVKTLKSMAKQTSIQPGCLSSRLYHDENEESTLMVEEVWRDQDDLDRYLRSEDFRRLLILVELAGQPPEIKFRTVSESVGLEAVEKVQGRTENEEE